MADLLSQQRNILMDLLSCCMSAGSNVELWKLHIDAAIDRLNAAVLAEAGDAES